VVRCIVGRRSGVGAGEDILTGGIEHTDVHVQSGTCHIAVRFRHERGIPALLACHAAHHALETQRLVAGSQRIGSMLEVHLELSRAVFGEGTGRGKTLKPSHFVDAREDLGEFIEVRHRVDLSPELAPACDRQRRWLRHTPFESRAINEIELVLERDHGCEVETMEAIEHLRQDMSWIREERTTVRLVHRHLNLRDIAALPGHGHQRIGQGLAGSIGVALVEPEAAFLDGAALNVQREHRARKHHAVGVEPLETLPLDAFAALDAVEVVQEDIDVSGVRMALEKPVELGKGTHGDSGRLGPNEVSGEGRSIRGRRSPSNIDSIKTVTYDEILEDWTVIQESM
jgi:hypothetical protein